MFFHVLGQGGPVSTQGSVDLQQQQEVPAVEEGHSSWVRTAGSQAVALLPYKFLPLESPWALVLKLGHTISGSHSQTF